MLSAGFKFMCCSTEDDADNPKINWNENLLSMQNLQVRQQEINNQVTMTFVAVNNDFTMETPQIVHRKHVSQESLGKLVPKAKLLHSLYLLSRRAGVNVLKELENVVVNKE